MVPPGVTDFDPESTLAPVHAPRAVQDVACEEVHESVVASPRAIVEGDATRLTLGGSTTATVAVAAASPAGPLQVRVYAVVAAGVTACEPEVAFVPLHPPEATQESTWLALQVRSAESPDGIVVGAADRSTTGGIAFRQEVRDSAWRRIWIGMRSLETP
jgi:hypothetical protein